MAWDAEPALRRDPAEREAQDWAAEAWQREAADGASEEAQGPWPAGPDDDPEFLLYLDQVIREIREAGNGT